MQRMEHITSQIHRQPWNQHKVTTSAIPAMFESVPTSYAPHLSENHHNHPTIHSLQKKYFKSEKRTSQNPGKNTTDLIDFGNHGVGIRSVHGTSMAKWKDTQTICNDAMSRYSDTGHPPPPPRERPDTLLFKTSSFQGPSSVAGLDKKHCRALVGLV